MKVLVTGGSGYIGSHTCVQLLLQGHEVIILDNLCNSKRSVLPIIERLGGKSATFVEGDIRNEALMTEILHDHAIEAVIHFAGLESRRRIRRQAAGILRQQRDRHTETRFRHARRGREKLYFQLLRHRVRRPAKNPLCRKLPDRDSAEPVR